MRGPLATARRRGLQERSPAQQCQLVKRIVAFPTAVGFGGWGPGTHLPDLCTLTGQYAYWIVRLRILAICKMLNNNNNNTAYNLRHTP
jgi:hypothetical protein